MKVVIEADSEEPDYMVVLNWSLAQPLEHEHIVEPPARGLRNKARRRIPNGQKTRRLRRRTCSDPLFMGSYIRDAQKGHHSWRNRGRKATHRK